MVRKGGEVGMKWEDFNNNYLDTLVSTNLIQTNIECPKCGKPLFKRTDIVLSSWPAQYQYECTCGFVGYSHANWQG